MKSPARSMAARLVSRYDLGWQERQAIANELVRLYNENLSLKTLQSGQLSKGWLPNLPKPVESIP
jgi:hypothetical protein